jgi:hypothetical protein
MACAIGIDLALASEQKSPPGQQMMSVSRPTFGVARPCARAICHRSCRSRQRDVREHDILFVRNAQFAEAEAVGEVGQRVHLHW